MKEIQEIVEKPTMNVIAFDKEGNTGGAASHREVPYYYMDLDSLKVETRIGSWVKK